jgi:hypothetical protein
MNRITVLTMVTLAVILTGLNIWGPDYFSREIAAVSSKPSRGIVFLNLAGIYFAGLLILPLASWLGFVSLPMKLTKLVVQVSAGGIVVALVLYATAGYGAAGPSTTPIAGTLVLACLGILGLASPVTIYGDIISHLSPPPQNCNGPQDLLP